MMLSVGDDRLENICVRVTIWMWHCLLATHDIMFLSSHDSKLYTVNSSVFAFVVNNQVYFSMGAALGKWILGVLPTFPFCGPQYPSHCRSASPSCHRTIKVKVTWDLASGTMRIAPWIGYWFKRMFIRLVYWLEMYRLSQVFSHDPWCWCGCCLSSLSLSTWRVLKKWQPILGYWKGSRKKKVRPGYAIDKLRCIIDVFLNNRSVVWDRAVWVSERM